MTRTLLLCLALLAAAPATATARDVAGVKVPDTMSVGGTELRLNGAGLRRATFLNVKVYVGALYVVTPSRDAAALVQADAPKSVRMRFLREVEKEKVMGAFRDGFEKNGPEGRALVPTLKRLEAAIPDAMKEGMELTVTYVPGKGTVVSGPAGEVTIEGKPFADAMFRNWLGPSPADADLKKELLGG